MAYQAKYEHVGDKPLGAGDCGCVWKVKLKEDEASGVIQSKFGYHILKLDEIIPSKLIPFSETKTDIMNVLLKKETQKLFKSYVEDLGNNANIDVFL